MRRVVTAIASMLLFAAAAAAQPMMCGTGIINPGDPAEKVLELCGQPAAAKQWVQNIPAGDDDEGYLTGIQIDWAEWAYQNSPDQFVNKVVLRNGVVYEIKSQ
jgi:hypothetical protein